MCPKEYRQLGSAACAPKCTSRLPSSRGARLVSHAISFCTICSLLIIALFLGAFFKTDVSNVIGVIFIAALAALAGGLVTFLREIYLATRTLRIGPH